LEPEQELRLHGGNVEVLRLCAEGGKRARKFLDERDYKVKECCGIVILEGITCEGTKDFGDCDRSCFFFGERSGWRRSGRKARSRSRLK
jgi:hypothetical protein